MHTQSSLIVFVVKFFPKKHGKFPARYADTTVDFGSMLRKTANLMKKYPFLRPGISKISYFFEPIFCANHKISAKAQ